MFSTHFRKPQLIPLLFMVAATMTFVVFGMWQLQRLQWKEGMLAEAQAAQALPALGTLPQSPDGLHYRNVALTGSFKHDKVLHVIGRQRGNFPGYFMVTPFILEDDGRVILVNRGFSPVDKETRPEGVQTVHGVIRPVREKRIFAPANQPEKNVWFYEDMDAMSKQVGVALTPVVVEAVGKEEKNVFPIPGDGKITMRNDHFGYAITWFSLAAVGLLMFAVYYRKR